MAVPNPWRVPLLAVAASWLLWGIVILAGPALPHAAITVLLMAGIAIVGVVAVLVAYGGPDRSQPRAFWSAITDVRRIPAPAWVAAILLMPALAFAGAMVDTLRSGTPLQAGELLRSAVRPLVLLRMSGFALLAGPFMEEICWRGLALVPLQRRYGGLAGATLLACVHALWHLPLFIAPDGYFHALGLLTPAFWRFMGDILVFDLLAAALFGFARSSTLAAVVFHGTFNAAGGLWLLSPDATAYRDTLAALVLLAVLVGTRGQLFHGRKGSASPP